MSASILINDNDARSALQGMLKSINNIDPALREIGEVLMDSTKQRFKTTTAPDGSQWERNQESTLINYANRFKSSRTKNRRLSKAGRDRMANKPPGTGESKQLQKQIFYYVGGNELTLGSPLIYASTFHYGAKKGEFGNGAPWGDIPARKVLGLSSDDNESIVAIVGRHLGFA